MTDENVEVTQADRDAAAEFISGMQYSVSPYSGLVIHNGLHMAQAFARHRQRHQPQEREAVLEAVALAARDFCAELCEDSPDVPQPQLAALHAALDAWEPLRSPCGLPCGWDCNHPEGCAVPRALTTPAPSSELEAVDPDELRDMIDCAISDSFDMDWTSGMGADAVVGAFEHNGWAVVSGAALTTPAPAVSTDEIDGLLYSVTRMPLSNKAGELVRWRKETSDRLSAILSRLRQQ